MFPVQTAECPLRRDGAPTVVVALQVSFAGEYTPPVLE
jgi:hypothetical protein